MNNIKVWTAKDAAASLKRDWDPAIVAELNGQYVKVVRAQGEFVWHFHENEDEMFYVLDGEMEMHLRNEVLQMKTGQACVIPRGMEHKPVVPKEVLLMVFEPKSTSNTGNVKNELTRETLARLDGDD